MINILDAPKPENCARTIQEQNSMAALIVDEISIDLILFHHIISINKSLKKK
jgi:hypothetical protein|tara:strand:+ start:4818 stop:4973 length:156 start_codon:yes stop_codon:yes gene_type:complete